MANHVWLLRHGEAVPHGARADSDRELTPHGEHQAAMAGRGLARLGVTLEHCYTSPKVRARETARLACQELGVNFELAASVGAGFDVAACRDLLLGHDDGAALLVVGHEPDLSQIVADLTGARVAFKKGGVAGLRLDGSRAELFALLRPRELESIARPAGP
jgi:phosphohistidine phosphatase